MGSKVGQHFTNEALRQCADRTCLLHKVSSHFTVLRTELLPFLVELGRGEPLNDVQPIDFKLLNDCSQREKGERFFRRHIIAVARYEARLARQIGVLE